MASNNPIELLISLAVNNGESVKNINENIRSLEKYYKQNPMLLSVDIDKAKALNNINKFIKEVEKQKINLDIDIKGSIGSQFEKIKSNTQDVTKEFAKLNQIANGLGSGSTKSFNIDLERVVIQLENLGRKGVVAQSQINAFTQSVKALKDTNDRLSLKEIVKDIFDVTSSSGHADKAMQALNKTLNSLGNAQNKLTGIKDKLGIDPSTNDEYQRLTGNVERLTSDLIKLQAEIATGNADQVKMAQQVRNVRDALAETTREISNFGKTAKADLNLTSVIAQANNLYESLRRAGKVDDGSLASFRAEINTIGNSAENSSVKIQRITQAIEKMRAQANIQATDNSFTNNLLRQEIALEKLEAKLIRIGQIHKSTVDKIDWRNAYNSLKEYQERLAQVSSPNQLRSLTTEYSRLASQIDLIGARATTASRASQGLGGALSQAFQKFPVWVFSATIFYAPIRGLQDLTAQVIELDTALVQLKRVLDVPDFKFNDIVERMLTNVKELSGVSSDYLKLTAEFARTGLNDDQSLELANVATVLQNISELTADEAVNSLTSATIAFKDEITETITVADRLNEINFISLLAS